MGQISPIWGEYTHAIRGGDRSPEGDPPRRRGQTRESGDAGGRATPGRKPIVIAAESWKHPRQPDEGRAEFTHDVPLASERVHNG